MTPEKSTPKEYQTISIRETIDRMRRLRFETEDEQFSALSDTLSGSSEFKELCLALAEEVIERELQADMVGERIKELQVRKARLATGADTLRNIILQAMEIREEKSLQYPTVTLSVSDRKAGIIIKDESVIPSQFFKAQKPELDKKAISDAVLKDGEIIPGIETDNGKISLTIRRK